MAEDGIGLVELVGLFDMVGLLSFFEQTKKQTQSDRRKNLCFASAGIVQIALILVMD